MRPRARTAANSQQGYTLVEVMMAVAIMTVGSVGILSLHQATTNGNRSAREMATATDLTRVYLERVRADALTWNSASAPLSTNTTYLHEVGNGWFPPAPTSTAEGFNYAGLDVRSDGSPVLVADVDAAYYCTNLRVTWLLAPEVARVEARVWWNRTASDTDRVNFNCNTTAANVTAELDPTATPAVPVRLRAVYASTVVRWSRLP